MDRGEETAVTILRPKEGDFEKALEAARSSYSQGGKKAEIREERRNQTKTLEQAMKAGNIDASIAARLNAFRVPIPETEGLIGRWTYAPELRILREVGGPELDPLWAGLTEKCEGIIPRSALAGKSDALGVALKRLDARLDSLLVAKGIPPSEIQRRRSLPSGLDRWRVGRMKAGGMGFSRTDPVENLAAAGSVLDALQKLVPIAHNSNYDILARRLLMLVFSLYDLDGLRTAVTSKNWKTANARLDSYDKLQQEEATAEAAEELKRLSPESIIASATSPARKVEMVDDEEILAQYLTDLLGWKLSGPTTPAGGQHVNLDGSALKDLSGALEGFAKGQIEIDVVAGMESTFGVAQRDAERALKSWLSSPRQLKGLERLRKLVADSSTACGNVLVMFLG